jgi:hypothetical protein
MHAPAFAAVLLAATIFLPVPAASAAGVDVEAFVRDEAVSQLKLSPDGRFYAAIIPGERRSMLAIVRREDNKATGMFSLGKDSYVLEFEWVNRDRVVIAMAEKIGMLDQPRATGNLYAMDADGGGTEILRDDRHVLVEVMGFKGDSGSRVEEMDIYSGVRRRQARSPVINASFTTDHAGEVRFVAGERVDNTQQLFHRAGANAEWELVNDEAESGIVEWPLGFSADNTVAYLQTERPGGPDAIVAFDPATGKRTEVFRDDDTDPAEVIRDGTGAPVGVRLHDGRLRSVFFDDASAEARLVRSLEHAFAGSTVRVASRTDDGRWVVAEVRRKRPRTS